MEYKYWSGDIELSGNKGRKQWVLILHVIAWAECIGEFLWEAELAELMTCVGTDWF